MKKTNKVLTSVVGVLAIVLLGLSAVYATPEVTPNEKVNNETKIVAEKYNETVNKVNNENKEVVNKVVKENKQSIVSENKTTNKETVNKPTVNVKQDGKFYIIRGDRYVKLSEAEKNLVTVGDDRYYKNGEDYYELDDIIVVDGIKYVEVDYESKYEVYEDEYEKDLDDKWDDLDDRWDD